MIDFTEDDDITGVLLKNKEDKKLSVLYFTATWCGPCKKTLPFIIELSEKLKNVNIQFYKIDIDKNEEFCDKCKIRSVPTFYVMNGKDLLSSITGSDTKKIGLMIANTIKLFIKK